MLGHGDGQCRKLSMSSFGLDFTQTPIALAGHNGGFVCAK
jgi:hypothetical protein